MKYTRDERKKRMVQVPKEIKASIRKQKDGRESGKEFSIPCLIEWPGVKHERRPLLQLSL